MKQLKELKRYSNPINPEYPLTLDFFTLFTILITYITCIIMPTIQFKKASNIIYEEEIPGYIYNSDILKK
jgi:hypothetical protein